jgi:hypothetical protein
MNSTTRESGQGQDLLSTQALPWPPCRRATQRLAPNDGDIAFPAAEVFPGAGSVRYRGEAGVCPVSRCARRVTTILLSRLSAGIRGIAPHTLNVNR